MNLDVVGMDMLARRDRLRCEADDLSIAADRVTLRDGVDRNLVPRRDHLGDHDLGVLGLEPRPGQQRLLGDHHIIIRVEQHRHIGEPNGAALGPAEQRGGRGGRHLAVLCD